MIFFIRVLLNEEQEKLGSMLMKNEFSNIKNEKENNIENNAESTFNWRVRLDVLNIKNGAEEDS